MMIATDFGYLIQVCSLAAGGWQREYEWNVEKMKLVSGLL